MLAIEKTVISITSSNQLLEYAERNWEGGYFDDVTIKLEDKVIKANRLVLSNNSLYFDKLFKEDKDKTSVDLTNLKSESVQDLIKFIYTGEIAIHNKNVFDLIAAADYLQMDEVKQFCFKFLNDEKFITADSWFFILIVGILYNNTTLIELCQKAKIILTEAELIDYIDRMRVVLVSETLIYSAIITWIKLEENARRGKIFDLFSRLLHFPNLPHGFTDYVIRETELVRENPDCHSLVNKYILVEKEINGKFRGKIVSVGGIADHIDHLHVKVLGDPSKSTDIHLQHERFHLKFAGKIDYSFYVAVSTGSSGGNVQQKVWAVDFPGSKEVAPTKFDLNHNEGKWVDNTASEMLTFFNPHDRRFYQQGRFSQKRDHFQYVLRKRKLYVLGGLEQNSPLSSVERVESTESHKIEHMQKPRAHFAAVNCEDKIYAIGGKSRRNKTINSVEVYDFEKQDWEYVRSMKFARHGHAACVVDGEIIVVGGGDDDGNRVHEIECYNPAMDAWSIIGRIETPLHDPLLIAIETLQP